MKPDELKELDELIEKYIDVTGYNRKQIVLVVSPNSEILKPDHNFGAVPRSAFGVPIYQHEGAPDDVFWLFHRNDIENLDDIIPDILGMVDEDIYIIDCEGCGHPINLELSMDNESVSCPWCQHKNELGDDE